MDVASNLHKNIVPKSTVGILNAGLYVIYTMPGYQTSPMARFLPAKSTNMRPVQAIDEMKQKFHHWDN